MKKPAPAVKLPSTRVMMEAWRGRPDSIFPPRPSASGYQETALFEPTSPPGQCALQRLRLHLTVQYLLSLPGRRILDTAAGACIIAACLHHAGREVVVNDIRPLDEFLRPWNLSGVLTTCQRDIFTLGPEEAGRFDIVVCTELIEHVAHPQELVRHLRRLLHPGGYLVLTTPNGSFIGNRLPTLSQVGSVAELERRQFRPDSDGHLFLLTAEELEELMVGARLEAVEVFHFGSPFTSGFLKVRHFSALNLPWFWYALEHVAHHAPSTIRAKVTSSLLACGRAPQRNESA